MPPTFIIALTDISIQQYRLAQRLSTTPKLHASLYNDQVMNNCFIDTLFTQKVSLSLNYLLTCRTTPDNTEFFSFIILLMNPIRSRGRGHKVPR